MFKLFFVFEKVQQFVKPVIVTLITFSPILWRQKQIWAISLLNFKVFRTSDRKCWLISEI